jgi:hypothetical protein
MMKVTAKSVLDFTEESKLELRAQHLCCHVGFGAPEESTRINR